MKNLNSWFCIFFIPIYAARASAESTIYTSTCESQNEEECRNEDSEKSVSRKDIRVVTREELESKTGENGSEIWLSVLGEVYDVTTGKSFYGKGNSYGALAGTDCSLCYVSGIFTADEATKHTDEISDSMLPGVLDWLSFYETHDSYNFIGYLVDPRFYDEEGDPTANLVSLRKRISSIQT